MTYAVIFDEMIEAGEEAYAECEAAGADRKTIVLQVYSAMEAIRIMKMIDVSGSIH